MCVSVCKIVTFHIFDYASQVFFRAIVVVNAGI